MQVEYSTTGPTTAVHPLAAGEPWLSAVPLFHAAWLFALGIVLASRLWIEPSLVLVALAPIVVLCCLAAWRAQRVIWLPLAVLWLLVGAWCAEMEPHPAVAPALASLSDGLLRTVEGTVTTAGAVQGEAAESTVKEDGHEGSAAVQEQPAQRIDLRVSSVEVVTDTDDRQTPVEGGVRLTVRWPADAAESAIVPFRCGERVRAVVRLLRPTVYHDPGVWSREEYLVDQGITATASANIERVERIGQAPGALFACRVNALQHLASSRLLALPAATHSLPSGLRITQEDAAMLAAMVTGDRTYLTRSIRIGFERTGSFHMLVVSGFHLAIVAGCIFWVARRLRLSRVPATLLTILGSFAYALFTGFATPVQRSLWMVTLYLLGRLVYRERRPLNTIGFAALCLLVVSPRSLLESSFQMTLLAVVAIAGIAAPLLESTVHPYLSATRDLRMTALNSKLPPHLAEFRLTLRIIASALQSATNRFIAWRLFPGTVRLLLRIVELLVVSCVVELAMTLPMALYFNRITVVALPVNMLILPLLSLLLPIALVTLLIALVWPAGAALPAIAVAFVLHCGTGLVNFFGALEWGDFRIPAPLVWQSLIFCALLAAAVVLARPVYSRHWPSRLAWTALFLAAFAAVAPLPIRHANDALVVEAIDVGQGDSILLITPDGKTMLVDGGGFGGAPRQAAQDYDIGEEVVSQALWSRGIRRLDVVALSHAHSDHMGGLPAVLRNFHPAELWVGNNPRSAAYQALLGEAASLHVHLRFLRAGDMLSLGAARVSALTPFSNYQPGAEAANNDSMVLRVAYGASSVLLEGDAEAPIEQAMLSEPGLQSTLLKVGHHGSRTSTLPEFLARVSPQWAVISCGLGNRYGHPRQEVLDELETARVRTYSTDINGAVCFNLDGKAASEVSCE
jgi:competence protein ComEC